MRFPSCLERTVAVGRPLVGALGCGLRPRPRCVHPQDHRVQVGAPISELGGLLEAPVCLGTVSLEQRGPRQARPTGVRRPGRWPVQPPPPPVRRAGDRGRWPARPGCSTPWRRPGWSTPSTRATRRGFARGVPSAPPAGAGSRPPPRRSDGLGVRAGRRSVRAGAGPGHDWGGAAGRRAPAAPRCAPVRAVPRGLRRRRPTPSQRARRRTRAWPCPAASTAPAPPPRR